MKELLILHLPGRFFQKRNLMLNKFFCLVFALPIVIFREVISW